MSDAPAKKRAVCDGHLGRIVACHTSLVRSDIVQLARAQTKFLRMSVLRLQSAEWSVLTAG